MQVSDFHFDLPDELIARYPMAERTASRLLQLDGQTGALRHGQFVDVLDQLNPGDLLVFNNTRVIPARMFGQKASGGKLEVLVERILDEHSVLAHVRASKAPKPGTRMIMDGGVEGEMRADTAVLPGQLAKLVPDCLLTEAANVFVFPVLQSANIAYKLVGQMGNREVIGPLLVGLKQPIHMVSLGSTVDEIVNMAALASYEAGR